MKLPEAIPAPNWAPAPSKHNFAAVLSSEIFQLLYFLSCGSSITKSSQFFQLPNSLEFPFSATGTTSPAGACGCHPKVTLPPLTWLVGECCCRFPSSWRCRRLKNPLCRGIEAVLTSEKEGFDAQQYFCAANQRTGQTWA